MSETRTQPDEQVPKQPLTLNIDSVAFGGKGIARHQGKVYFIPDTIPGDIVECSIEKEKKRFAEAVVIRFVEKSTLRSPSPCLYSSTCGGCQWQEVEYKRQLVWKSKFISDSLTRISGIDALELETINVSPSPKTQHYRNKVHLRGRIYDDGSIGVGYFKSSTRDQIHITHCKIASAPLNQFIKTLSGHKTAAPAQKFRIEIQQLPAQTAKKSPDLLTTLIPAEKNSNKLHLLADEIGHFDGVLWSGLSRDIKNSTASLFEAGELKYFSSPGQFQQINSAHNLNLRKVVFDLVSPIDPDSIVDLFCGSGNLSLQLADGQRKIDGFEFDKRAIANGKKNIAENKLKNINFHCGDAREGLVEFIEKTGQTPDLLIVDPPRAGMAEIVAEILKFKPRDLIYISCDPSTLARDLGALLVEYRLKKVQGFDFFPNTFHVETLCHLELRVSG